MRGLRFWYNSCFIVTMIVENVRDLKGVPRKNKNVISETGVKIQKLKIQNIFFEKHTLIPKMKVCSSLRQQ